MVRLLRALAAFVLALAPLATSAEGPGSLFLVAKGQLVDPNFSQSVVLLTQFGRMGSLGVIVNRPTGLTLARAFPDIKRNTQPDDKLFFGGPVQRDAILFVFRSPDPPEEASEVMDGIYISSDRAVLLDLLGRDKPVEGMRVFMGYAGWSPGQLENEIRRGDWDVMQADAKSIFAKKPESLWPELSRRASETTARRGSALVPAVMTMKGGRSWR
jgi:putative transcriptional regulator